MSTRPAEVVRVTAAVPDIAARHAGGGGVVLLAVVGAYGIIHRSVASRTQEIGIRTALGASASSVLRMVLASGLSFGLIGLVLGFVGSAAHNRAVASFLTRRAHSIR